MDTDGKRMEKILFPPPPKSQGASHHREETLGLTLLNVS